MMGGYTMHRNPQVKCIVSTCNHWVPNNLCGADTIDIWHQQKGEMSQSVDETQCKSFYKREGVLGMIGSLHNANIGGVAAALLPGETLAPRVHCIVSTCVHWADGDACTARAIEVTGGKADESEDSNCQTFRMSAEGQRGPTKARLEPNSQ
jgi:hypothetical protein